MKKYTYVLKYEDFPDEVIQLESAFGHNTRFYTLGLYCTEWICYYPWWRRWLGFDRILIGLGDAEPK